MPTRLPRRLTRTLLTAGAVASLAAAAYAVTPGQFTHTTEADFADGDAYGTVITNLGDIKLSSDTTPIDGLPEDVETIFDIATHRQARFVACGPDAKILMLKDGEATVVAEFPGEQVYAIEDAENGLYVGVSGSNARVILLPRTNLVEADGPIDWAGLPVVWELPEEAFIWDLKRNRTGHVAAAPKLLYAATGPNGRVYRLSLENDGGLKKIADKVFEANQTNILSLGLDESKAGREALFAKKAIQFYAGTDQDGLIYRIDADGNPFVVYDAPEAEIGTLAVTADGTLYAGTAAADQAKPGRQAQPIKEETGRPAVEETPEPIEEPDAPAEDPQAADEADGESAGPGADNPAEEAAAARPTPEQYDALREALKERLEVARETGEFDADVAPGNDNAANAGGNKNANAQPSRPSRAKPAAPGRAKPGNAVYQIAPDGFVTEVFRESVTIQAVVPQADGRLIVATGNEGQVFSVDPPTRETTVLADLDSAQVTAAVPTDTGLLLGAAGPGALMRMDNAVAEQGGFTSQVLDAGQVSLFGTFKLTADIPAGTTVAVELRSGNVGDPEQAAWSKWTKPILIKHDAEANPLQPREIKADVPPARFLQYRLTLTGDGKSTPVIDQTDLAYVAPNTAPTVSKLTVTPAKVGEPGSDPDPKVTLQWQATDDNADRLVYSLEYKPGKADKYLPLADGITANKYEWQTRHVPDGWYTLRLTAHDKLDNPPNSAKSGGRVSEPVLIDNTAPTLDGLEAEALGGGKVRLTATAGDELSAIASVSYSIDGSEDYQASLPDDLIYDSTSEPWGVTIPDLSPGGHVIAVRAIDARGNTAYRQLIVEVQ